MFSKIKNEVKFVVSNFQALFLILFSIIKILKSVYKYIILIIVALYFVIPIFGSNEPGECTRSNICLWLITQKIMSI